MQQSMRFVPNILSTLRLGFACVFPFVPEALWLWLIVGSGCSDVLDGWIARKWQVQSRQGAILDAVADKLFILAAMLTVARAGRFSLWWVPFLLSRDLLVAFTAAYAVAVRSWDTFNRMEVRWTGKIATAGQFLLLLTAVLCPEASMIILLPTMLLSMVAACDYARFFIRKSPSK